jgi:hypothetical protein
MTMNPMRRIAIAAALAGMQGDIVTRRMGAN